MIRNERETAVNSAHLHHPTRHRSHIEERLLLKLARRAAEPSLYAGEIEILTQDSLQESFFALAARQGVQGLVLSKLSDPQRAPFVPARLAERAWGSLRGLQLEAVLWDLERDRLVACLGEAGLSPVVLKGAALRQTAYSQSAERPVADLDLLVAEGELDAAIAALRTVGYTSPGPEEAVSGYREHHYHVRLVNENGFIVELHWGLIRPGRPFTLDAAAFLRRSIVHRRSKGPDLRVPTPEDMILHMTSQNLEGFFRLGRLVDIDRVVHESAALDWDYLRSASRAGGLEVALALTLQLCRLLLGTPVPEGYIDRLGVPFTARVHLALMRPARWPFAESPGRVAANQLRQLWCVGDWRARLKLISEMLEGKDDPLRWLWEGEAHALTRPPAPFEGLASLVKLAGYQAWLYGAAALAAVGPRGRSKLRFWSRAPGSGSRAELRPGAPSYSIRSSRSSSRS